MRIAVVGLKRGESIEADFEALEGATLRACAAGAKLVIPAAPAWFAEAGISQSEILSRLQAKCPDRLYLGDSSYGAGSVPARWRYGASARFERTPLGMTASLVGDECLDAEVARDVGLAAPDALVLRPGSESDLQAEAMIERAVVFSESVAGLVIVAEADGASPGAPGHGGSAIVVLGELMAEEVGGDDVLVADVSVLPVSPPEPREPIPDLQPILAQRLARHRGERVPVSYPADLS